MQHVVTAKSLTKSFGDLKAVDDVSFQIETGESFGLLGPNGAGKTSLIRMIYGFSPMTGGELRVFGLDIRSEWRAIKSRIGVCQQENTLDPDLSVHQNLEVFARYFGISKGEARRRSEELLTFMALAHRRRSPVNELSGGMVRRLVLARALINSPELLILDEPTTGLDPQSRHQIWQRLDDLKASGISTLLTTHYMSEASRLCSRLVIMDKGRILVEGKPKELIDRYVGDRVLEIQTPTDELRRFISARNVPHEDLGHRILIYGREKDELFHAVTDTYCDERCLLRLATLEDVFLKLTGRELRE